MGVQKILVKLLTRNIMKSTAKQILFLIALCGILSAGGRQDLQISTEQKGFSLASEGYGNVLDFIVPDYQLESVFHLGTEFKQITLEGGGSIVNENEPDLPSVTTYYQIEPGKDYSVNLSILESETFSNINLIPKYSWDDVEPDPLKPLRKNRSIYESDNIFPEQIAKLSTPLIMRDIHIVAVTVTPFQYRPSTQELEVIKSARVELIGSGYAAAPPVLRKRSRAFENLYKSFVVNYSRTQNEADFQRPSILYIMPDNTSSSMTSVFDALLEWRKEQGFIVNTVNTSSIGNSTTSIKNYISNAYNNWNDPPEFVAIVADAGGTYSIPTYFETWSGYSGEGDHPYTTLEGNDQLPEVLIGRISISSVSELATIVNKILYYEKTPYMGVNWFTRACLVGDPNSSSGISTITTNEYIRELMEAHGYDGVQTVYSGDFDAQMVSHINDGVAYVNYRGWLGVSGFDTGDVNGLNNGFMLPYFSLITCGTGSFAGAGAEIIETLIRAGTVSQPKGAVAAVGTATIHTHTMFNNAVDMGFYHGLFIDQITSAGGTLMAGKLNLMKQYPTNPENWVNIFSHWNNLMGDPAITLWTDTPKSMSVSIISTLKKGTNYLDVFVEDDIHDLLENARITLYKENEIHALGFTDPEGNLTVALNDLSVGDLTVTILYSNYVPHQSTIQVTEPDINININLDDLVVIDDGTGLTSGNGDGLLNGGETIEIITPITNLNSSQAVGVFATLSSSSDHITIVSDSVYFGLIDTAGGPFSSDPFVFQVAENVREGENLSLRLNIEDIDGREWSADLNLSSVGSDVVFGPLTIVDLNDGLINPGETVELSFALKNNGSTNATNVAGTLTSSSSLLEVVDNISLWGTLPPSQTYYANTDAFSVSAQQDIIPGTIVNLNLHLTSTEGLTLASLFPVQIGTAGLNDPMGPDEYGYYIYDSGDFIYSNSPAYNWIEIDTRYGGSGQLIPLYDSGDDQDGVVTLTLPFTFRMYGLAYDQISVCSNGWISMGSTTMNSFRNYHLPGAGGPSPMIAAFWDDLVIGTSGRIYRYNDVENHQYIVEWSRVSTYDKYDLETFQVILRNPTYYFTPTGDGEILMQYKTFNNTSSGQYSWSQVHGSYSTIGIEDHTGTVGLEYTFNNEFPLTAMPLADSTAILVTTRGAEIMTKGDLNYDNRVDIFDLITLVDFIGTGEPVSLNPYLADINGDGQVTYFDMIALIKAVMNLN